MIFDIFGLSIDSDRNCSPIEQIPTVTVTSIQATFVLVTFVHIRNISAASDLISLCFEPGKTSIVLLLHAQND